MIISPARRAFLPRFSHLILMIPQIPNPRHIKFVGIIARRLAPRLPRFVRLEEMLNDGLIGLTLAARRYDPRRGVPFGAFAAPRVRGAILDGAQERHWWSRQARQSGTVLPAVSSLCHASAVESDAEQRMEHREWTTRAVRRLPDRARLVIRLYYFEGMSMKQIAQTLGISESRVSQFHAWIIRRLRLEARAA
jgi:RNA polymerase sigma factor for flagellar operon FliA